MLAFIELSIDCDLNSALTHTVLTKILGDWFWYCAHFIDEEIQAQRTLIIHRASEMAELGFEPRPGCVGPGPRDPILALRGGTSGQVDVMSEL